MAKTKRLSDESEIEKLDIDLISIMKSMSYSMVFTDSTCSDSPVIFVNSAFSELTGYLPQDLIGRNCRILQGPESDRVVIDEIKVALNEGAPIRRELVNYRKNGEAFWNDVAINPVRDRIGKLIGFVSIHSDATARRAIQSSLCEIQQRLQAITTNIPGYIYQRVLKPDGALILPFISPSLNAILGLGDAPVTVDDFFRHLHPDDHNPFWRALKKSARELSLFREEIRLICRSGEIRWFRSEAMPRPIADGAVAWDGMAVEITSEKRAKSELSFLASHDPLTGLHNRQAFRSAVSAQINRFSDGRRAALFYIDLDGFQSVNDSAGAAFGDKVLRRVGVRLMEFVEGHGGSAARLGGDEFAILLPSLSSDIPALEIADMLRSELSRPMTIDGRETILAVSIGASLFPLMRDAIGSSRIDVPTEFMERAYLALCDAKRLGSGRVRLDSPDFDGRFRTQRALRQSLERAVNDLTEFELHYQPLVDLHSGEIVSAEALIRWNHPELGFQSPDFFIPLAETSGLIIPLGAWVLRDAMAQLRRWQASGIRTPQIAINVSATQLQSPGFIDAVQSALAESGASAHDFELELTEGVLIDASIGIRTQLIALKSMGFELAIDDFGTGHSTFKYLRDFPVDKIKIDQTFVRQLVIGSSNAMIVRSMIGLARSLKMQVVAEGIETTMQRDFLRDEVARSVRVTCSACRSARKISVGFWKGACACP